MAALLPAWSAAAAPVQVLGGTAITIHAANPISSSTAMRGQTFQIVAAHPLVMQGWVVVKRGAVGQGRIVAASPAGKSGRQGSLSIQTDWIFAADGSKLPLTETTTTDTGRNKKGVSNAANIAGTLLLGPVGLFAHNFVKGKDITIGPSFTFKTYVGRTKTVMASHKFSSTP